METRPFKTISVVGSGFMGTLIGFQCAAHGYTVRFIDIIDEALRRSSHTCSQELEARVERRQITANEKEAILKRMHFTLDLKEGVSNADLAIEAVPERLETKRAVFAQLDQLCPSRTILATNSSSLRISQIEGVARRRDKVLNSHFWGSIWQNSLVELMRGTATSDETIETMRRFANSIEVLPMVVRKESTGFIFNRVWRAIKKECLRVVAEGVASHEDVDRAWMILMKTQIGPFGSMDRVGLDVVRDIEMVYYRNSGIESDAPPQFLLDKVERGELGVKAGKGFYTYPNPAFQESGWLRGGKE